MKLSLEHLAFLPPNAALALLLAVWPMCRCAWGGTASGGTLLAPRGIAALLPAWLGSYELTLQLVWRRAVTAFL